MSLTKASVSDNVDNVQVFYTQSPGLRQTTQAVKGFLGKFIDETKGPVNFVHSVVKTPDSNGKYNLCQLLGDHFVCEEHDSAKVVKEVLAKEQDLKVVDSESLFELPEEFKSKDKLEEVVKSVKADFIKKGGYKLLENNCNHAANDFVRLLSKGKVGIKQSVVNPIETFIKPEMQGTVNDLIDSQIGQQILGMYRNPVSAVDASQMEDTEETTSQMSDPELEDEAAKRFQEIAAKEEESKQRAVKKLQKLNFPGMAELETVARQLMFENTERLNEVMQSEQYANFMEQIGGFLSDPQAQESMMQELATVAPLSKIQAN